MRYYVRIGDKNYSLELTAEQAANGAKSVRRWTVLVDNRELAIEAVQTQPNGLSLIIDGQSFEARKAVSESAVRISLRGHTYNVSIEDLRSLRSRRRASSDETGPQRLVSSMPGRVVRVLANEGDNVLAGAGVVVIEAMKMQNEIKSPKGGILMKVLAKPGANVNAGDVLAIVQ
jgi:biotin carboxyl carrier protein